MVGPFFYIVSKNFTGFISHRIKEEGAEKYGDFLVDPKSHADLFDARFKNSTVEYFKFPRGRVAFNIGKDIHILHLDKCLKGKALEIAALFEIKEFVVAFDEHYVCPKCEKDIWD